MILPEIGVAEGQLGDRSEQHGPSRALDHAQRVVVQDGFAVLDRVEEAEPEGLPAGAEYGHGREPASPRRRFHVHKIRVSEMAPRLGLPEAPGGRGERAHPLHGDALTVERAGWQATTLGVLTHRAENFMKRRQPGRQLDLELAIAEGLTQTTPQLLVRDLEDRRPALDEPALQTELDQRLQREPPIVRVPFGLELEVHEARAAADPNRSPRPERTGGLLHPRRQPHDPALPALLGPPRQAHEPANAQ